MCLRGHQPSGSKKEHASLEVGGAEGGNVHQLCSLSLFPHLVPFC